MFVQISDQNHASSDVSLLDEVFRFAECCVATRAHSQRQAGLEAAVPTLHHNRERLPACGTAGISERTEVYADFAVRRLEGQTHTADKRAVIRRQVELRHGEKRRRLTTA